MRAKLIKVIERPGSANGASRCYIICFKGVDGKSYRTWTDDRLGNYKRWYNAILASYECARTNDELWLDGLIVKGKDLVDADSHFTMERIKAPSVPFVPDHESVTRPEIERKDTA